MASCGATRLLWALSALCGPGLLTPENRSESAWTGKAAGVTRFHWLLGTKHTHAQREENKGNRRNGIGGERRRRTICRRGTKRKKEKGTKGRMFPSRERGMTRSGSRKDA